jgi:cyanophycinase-like exopeptidase
VSRILALLGSGETTPTMVSTHQRVVARVGDDRVVVDTPYGFQENADELSARTRDYFARHVGVEVRVLSLRRAADASPVARETAAARLREADWVFAGPGSPTYLTAQWHEAGLPPVLRERLTRAGASVYASAAACTVGALTVPVYEIYKAGADPTWAPGLDLLAPLGLDAVVVPHFDNAEGGTHDTRYCYLGARRLALLEARLPASTWVLGVDEHTAAVLDLDAGTLTVEGRGGVTVRARDVEVVVPTGTTAALDAVLEAAAGRPDGALPAAPTGTGRGSPASDAEVDATGAEGAGSDGDVAAPDGLATPGGADGDGEVAVSPLLEAVATAATTFDAAVSEGRLLAAAEATVALEITIAAWAADPNQSDEADRARAELRRQVVALARTAQAGWHAHRDLVAPHVDLLLELRRRARTDRRFAEADAIRDTLTAAGVEVRDRTEGTDWVYHDPIDPGPVDPDAG